MNYKMMGRFVAQIVMIEGVFLLPALSISIVYGEWASVRGFLWALGVMIAVSGTLFALCRKAGAIFGAREGLACVGIGWIALSMLGCVPFVISGAIPSYIDALFEIVSGFTTTGSSILADVESLPKGLLYWRSFSHWVGGMGVLVFLLALAPTGGHGFTLHLLRAESPGPDVGKLVPKIRKTATILYCIYIVMTVLNFLFLLAGDMSWLEALCTAFGTAGTGGFGVKNDSMASYSPYIQNVTTVFMLLFGVNFSCYYLLLLGNFRSVFKDEELRTYVALVLGIILLITLDIRGMYATLEETVRHASFQVASIVSTSGFVTTDFDLWPTFSKGLLMLLLLTGACAGSTCGGFKIARMLLVLKSLGRNIRQVLNPRRVLVVRNNGRTVSQQVLDNTNAYLAAYVVIIVVSHLLLSMEGFSFGTTISAVLTCFNNVGPGFEAVGPTCNFSGFSNFSKLVLTLDMLAGRLEIFPILALFSKDTWLRK